MKRSYPTDLSDAEWGCLEPYVPPPNKRGRPRAHAAREILDAVFYVLKSGCPWWLLPKDFPPWETVYWWFGRWRVDGTLERLNAALRERLGSHLGRNPLPSAAIADSQTTKTTGVGGEQRSYNGNNKVRGRKRHLLVDTEGLVLKARVHSAKVPDQDGLKLLLESARGGVSRLSHLWLDAGYQGRGKRWAEEVGGGADLLVVGAEQEDEQRLREAVRQRGSVRLRGDDPFDGEASSPWLRIFKKFRRGSSRNSGRREFSEVRMPTYALPSSDGEQAATNHGKICLAPLQEG